MEGGNYSSSSDDEEKKTIVVAVDESKESMHALSWCLNNLMGDNNGIRLVLLYVKPPPPVYSSLDAAGFFLGWNEIATMEKHSKEAALAVMDRAESIYRDYDIKVEKKVGAGEAKDVICLAVEKLRADMLVMGSHDYGFFKRAILGSVSEYCAKNVKCPIVVVKLPRANNNNSSSSESIDVQAKLMS